MFHHRYKILCITKEMLHYRHKIHCITRRCFIIDTLILCLAKELTWFNGWPWNWRNCGQHFLITNMTAILQRYSSLYTFNKNVDIHYYTSIHSHSNKMLIAQYRGALLHSYHKGTSRSWQSLNTAYALPIFLCPHLEYLDSKWYYHYLITMKMMEYDGL